MSEPDNKVWTEVDAGVYVTGDGVSLNNILHPQGEPVAEDAELNPDSLETIEVDFPDIKEITE